jgi:Ca-activated chloride channel family protein
MTFLWPGFLILLGLIPLFIALYIWMLRRQRVGLRYSSLSLVRSALPRYSYLKRHLPFALFLLALAGLTIALARPIQIVSVPAGQATIILALDVSGSMRQTDVQPSRLEAAENAALSFIQSQKSGTEFGLVAFAGYAELVQAPTSDQEALDTSIYSLTTGRGTAIGSGILKSLDAISQVDPLVAPSVADPSAPGQPTPVPKGDYAPDIVVLLTDGVANTGPPPLETAQEAADRGVRIYTISFGTAAGSSQFGPGFGGPTDPFGGGGQQPGGGFGGGGFGRGGGFNRGIDDTVLKQIADMTGGTYHTASSADELLNVFQNLPTYLITKHEVTEISVVFAAFGALIVALAIALAMRWHPLP